MPLDLIDAILIKRQYSHIVISYIIMVFNNTDIFNLLIVIVDFGVFLEPKCNCSPELFGSTILNRYGFLIN